MVSYSLRQEHCTHICQATHVAKTNVDSRTTNIQTRYDTATVNSSWQRLPIYNKNDTGVLAAFKAECIQLSTKLLVNIAVRWVKHSSKVTARKNADLHPA